MEPPVGLRFATVLLPILAFPIPAVPAARQAVDPDRAEVVSQFLERGWDFEIGKTIEDITRRFGKPISVQRRRTANRHNPRQVDEIYEVRCKGLQVSKYKANPKGEESYELLLLVSITGPEYRARHGLGVGTPFERVKQVLGPPSAETPGYLRYEDPESNTTVEFQETRGRISRIEWTFRPD